MQKKLFIISFAVLFLLFSLIARTNAVSLTSMSDVMTRLEKNKLSNHLIQFTTSTGVAAGQTIIVTFPSDFAPESGIDFTDIDLIDDGSDLTLAATPSGATWGAVFGGAGNRTLTFTSGTGTIAGGSVVAIKIGTNAASGAAGDKQINNPTGSGSYVIAISGTFGDTGSISVAIANSDQVTATAKVDPYLSFEVTDGTVDFGTLSFSVVRTDTASMTAATNSSNGYSITVFGPTLTNGVNTINAIGGTAAASIPGTEQFGFNVSATGGQGQAISPYNDTGTPKYAFDGITSADEMAASTQKSKTTTYNITYMANIADDTEPGTYTAVHTFICTGNY